ncbi:MAG: FGGY-family carbohydrate kinase, partial [Alphaproteobacteria bacterium]
MSALLIGLDIGTTSTIGTLIDGAGATLATVSRETELHSEHPNWAEEDPAQWWANACAVIRELLEVAQVDAEGGPIAAVGVTGMVPALVLLDADGRPLRRSIQQNDARAIAEIAAMAEQADADQFFAMTGGGINQQLIGPKLRWLERHEPEVWRRIATIFGSYDYIAYRLSGALGVERNWALESGLYDVGERGFTAHLLELGQARAGWLPPIRDAHEVVGAVTAAAAAETGLAEGTPVVAGCADHVASAFVAGVVGEGDLLVKFGGAGDILLATADLVPDRRLFVDYHIVPGLHLTNGCMAASGSVLKWIAREFGRGTLSFPQLDALAATTPPGAEGLLLLPYFLGEKTPLHDPHARGTLVGLGLHHGLGHVWRAALEGVVYGFRHHLAVFDEMGLEVKRVVSSNGGSQSATWLQIAADCLGH